MSIYSSAWAVQTGIATSDDKTLFAVCHALDATGLSEFCADGENAGAFLDALQNEGYAVVKMD